MYNPSIGTTLFSASSLFFIDKPALPTILQRPDRYVNSFLKYFHKPFSPPEATLTRAPLSNGTTNNDLDPYIDISSSCAPSSSCSYCWIECTGRDPTSTCPLSLNVYLLLADQFIRMTCTWNATNAVLLSVNAVMLEYSRKPLEWLRILVEILSLCVAAAERCIQLFP